MDELAAAELASPESNPWLRVFGQPGRLARSFHCEANVKRRTFLRSTIPAMYELHYAVPTWIYSVPVGGGSPIALAVIVAGGR